MFCILNLSNPVYGQEQFCDPEISIIDNSTGQCVPICGEGLELKGEQCVEKPQFENLEGTLLIIGVVIAAVATGVGIILTLKDRRKERAKRTQELIQMYDEELREIAEQEKNLDTKLDCALYVERYLDTVEKIATLSLAGNFQGFVSDFFENNFSYAIELWRWYQKNVVNIRGDFIGEGAELGALWKAATDFKEFKKNKNENQLKKDIFNELGEKHYDILKKLDEKGIENENKKRQKAESEFIRENYSEQKFEELLGKYYQDEEKWNLNNFKNSLNNFKNSLYNYYNNERWREFRTWCNKKDSKEKMIEITPFVNDFDFLQTTSEMEKQEGKKIGKYRILPDVLYEQYEDIPEENGLTKGELVGIIRGFSKDLAKIGEMEKNFKKDEDCSIYAEQFLDTLEEISSLYRSDMIPRRAADYFENKFSYGRNLWDWYHTKVLNYSKELTDSLWTMEDKDPWQKNENGKKFASIEIEKKNFTRFALLLLKKINPSDEAFNEDTKPQFPDNQLITKDEKSIIEYFKGDSVNEEIRQIISPDTKFNALKPQDQIDRIRNFVSNFIKNERWRDFRYWCKRKEIDPFEEDESLGLVLPRRMWKVKFKK
jgi:hypothetical protein